MLVGGLQLGIGGFAGVPPGSIPTNTITPPTFEQLSSNVVARSTWDRSQNTAAKYLFSRIRVLEEFDAKGKITDHKQSRQECFPINGVPFARLIQKDGQLLNEKETKVEEEREAAVRSGKKGGRSADGSKRDKPWQFTDEMLARYTFKITGQELVRDRPAWVVEFTPRSKDLPVKKPTDRVANKVAGKLWVDTEEWEVARLKFWLTEEVTVVGGVAGVLRKFEMTLDRTRLDPNAWMPTILDFEMAGREVMVNKRLHYHEESKNFKPVPAAKAEPKPVAPKPAVADK